MLLYYFCRFYRDIIHCCINYYAKGIAWFSVIAILVLVDSKIAQQSVIYPAIPNIKGTADAIILLKIEEMSQLPKYQLLPLINLFPCLTNINEQFHSYSSRNFTFYVNSFLCCNFDIQTTCASKLFRDYKCKSIEWGIYFL